MVDVDNWGLLADKTQFFGMELNQQTADFNFGNFDFDRDYNNSFQANEQTTVISEHLMRFHMQRKGTSTMVVVVLPNVTLTVLRYDKGSTNIVGKVFCKLLSIAKRLSAKQKSVFELTQQRAQHLQENIKKQF